MPLWQSGAPRNEVLRILRVAPLPREVYATFVAYAKRAARSALTNYKGTDER